ncbi:TFIIB-type zinc ribbon-containing protein [Plantactinospora sonchi]|uniref:TFIIB-type zinc ribbon-containing protein n=1 Tax=Plantactinospora sonchi TaxID=1544735 RepID=A0ABU7RR66_9ACTN
MAGDRGAGFVPVTCPDCGGPVRPDRERLCPRCGYPLMFLRGESEPEARVVARTPGEAEDVTAIFAPPGAPPRQTPAGYRPVTVRPGEVACPSCGYGNPVARIRCQRCGRELRVLPVTVLPPPLPPAPAPIRRRPRYGLIALVAALVVAAVAATGLLVARSGLLPNRPGATPSAAPVPIPADRVRADASSIVPDSARFAVGNLLDGDLATCWQSDGDRIRNNIGVRLTFEFDAPVRVARITLVNGYARTPTDYRNNERAARLTVVTEGGSVPWTLPDTAEAQTIDLPTAAPTGTVTLVVEEVYPGSRFRDLAITEITFAAQP